ncbi:hypothetical protein LCGC14_0870740, partial [marine sediment metagenome]
RMYPVNENIQIEWAGVWGYRWRSGFIKKRFCVNNFKHIFSFRIIIDIPSIFFNSSEKVKDSHLQKPALGLLPP